jgi:glycerol-3-phosphate acyltransferase PlsY
MKVAILLIGCYLVGSIPFGVIVGRLVRGVDIRKYGSGNIGFSNVLRVLGPGPAAIVLAADALKGFVPVLVGRRLLPTWSVTDLDLALLAVGFAPILGHSFSVFLGFRGGRGVTTTGGVLLGLCWPAALTALAVWLGVVGVTRYISLGSVAAAVSVPIYMVIAGRRWEWIVFWALVAALVILRHISNIGRLLAGTETKIGQRADVGDRDEQSRSGAAGEEDA